MLRDIGQLLGEAGQLELVNCLSSGIVISFAHLHGVSDSPHGDLRFGSCTSTSSGLRELYGGVSVIGDVIAGVLWARTLGDDQSE